MQSQKTDQFGGKPLTVTVSNTPVVTKTYQFGGRPFIVTVSDTHVVIKD